MNVPNTIAIGISTLTLVLLVALSSGGGSNHSGSEKSLVYDNGSSDAIELCRKGMGLLEKDGGENVKANALVERAWELQSSYPAITRDVWKMTQHFVENTETQNKLPLLAIYLQSVDDAVESATTLREFETTWAVRQSVLKQLKDQQNNAAERLNQKTEQLGKQLKEKGVKQTFSGDDDGKWTDVALEISAMQDSLANISVPISASVSEVQSTIDSLFNKQIETIESEFKDQASGARSSAGADSIKPDKVKSSNGAPEDRGPYTQLLYKLQADVQLRNSSAVVAWLSLASSVNESSNADSAEIKADKYLESVQKLQVKLIEARNLEYNLWALNIIYKAAPRSGNGLKPLGKINTRLLTSAVAASYSSTESKLIDELKRSPSNHQSQIRTMLRIPKRTIDSF